MVRKECFQKIAFFPLDMPYACDWYLWCVFALQYNVAYFSEPMVGFRVHQDSLTTSFNRDEAPICIVDELKVLCRVCHQAELAGAYSLRDACHESIASHAARALRSGLKEGSKTGLSQAGFEELLRQGVEDPKEEEDLRARVYTALGDEQCRRGEYRQAERSYRLGLGLRPWRLKTWIKYFLVRTGSIGVGIRRLLSAKAEDRETPEREADTI